MFFSVRRSRFRKSGWRSRLIHTVGGAKNEEHHGQIHRKGMLFAAGLITGEALMGIFIAIPIVVTGKGDVLALPANLHFGGWLGLALLAWIAWLLYRFATKPDAQVAAQ